eukprot:6337058-Amphidinium_carterae.2
MSRWRPSEQHGSLGVAPALPFTTCSRIQLGPLPFPDVARAAGLSTHAEGAAQTNAQANPDTRTNSRSLVSHQAGTDADARTNSHSQLGRHPTRGDASAGGLADDDCVARTNADARPLSPGLENHRAPINFDARTNSHSEGHLQVSTPHTCGLHHVWLSHGPDILANVVTWNAVGLLHLEV